MLLCASVSAGAMAPLVRSRQLVRGLPGRGLVSSRKVVLLKAEESKGTPSVMLSGEETDEGDMAAGDYCSIDSAGKRVKKGNRR
jgi:hypothetical protein